MLIGQRGLLSTEETLELRVQTSALAKKTFLTNELFRGVECEHFSNRPQKIWASENQSLYEKSVVSDFASKPEVNGSTLA